MERGRVVGSLFFSRLTLESLVGVPRCVTMFDDPAYW